jgi:hypothetical protein
MSTPHDRADLADSALLRDSQIETWRPDISYPAAFNWSHLRVISALRRASLDAKGKPMRHTAVAAFQSTTPPPSVVRHWNRPEDNSGEYEN